MPQLTTISSRNRLITVQRIFNYKDSKLIPHEGIYSTFITFAKVEQISNSYTLQQLQVHFGEGYRFTVREEPTQPIYETDNILYENRKYTINGIRPYQEGARRDLIITASVSNKSGLQQVNNMLNVNTELHTIGNVVIGGSDYANWSGKILLDRDGRSYMVVRDGSATTEQVNYDASTGLFTFNPSLPDLRDTERVNAYFFV